MLTDAPFVAEESPGPIQVNTGVDGVLIVVALNVRVLLILHKGELLTGNGAGGGEGSFKVIGPTSKEGQAFDVTLIFEYIPAVKPVITKESPGDALLVIEVSFIPLGPE